MDDRSKVSVIFLAFILLFTSNPISSAFSEEVPIQLNNLQDEANLFSPVDAFDDSATYNKLLEKTQNNGNVRIIIELATDFQPEGKMSALKDKMNQRENIGNAQKSLMQTIPTAGIESSHKFKYIPFMAMTVNENALENLRDTPLVKSIQEDVAYPLLLSDSTGIVGADPESFSLGFTGQGQTVVIADTGVESGHEFLSGKVVAEACFSDTINGAQTFCPNNQNEQIGPGAATPCTGCYHGTHVAGIAAGKESPSPNAESSGIAKGANIIAIQVFSDIPNCGVCSYTSDQIKALEHVYALYMDPNFNYEIAAVNFSLGGLLCIGPFCQGYISEAQCDSFNSATKAAVETLRLVGIATIASSGNDYLVNAMRAPACLSNVVSVGSTTKSDNLSIFSNSADFLNVVATGSSIRSSLLGNTYGTLSGTSMAAPTVTGAWAILKQFSPQATVSQVLLALENSGVTIIDDREPCSICPTNLEKPRIQIDQALIELGYVPPLDSDADGIADLDDNCPATSNATQLDGDSDGAGDVCDPLLTEFNSVCDGQDGSFDDGTRFRPIGVPGESTKVSLVNGCDLEITSDVNFKATVDLYSGSSITNMATVFTTSLGTITLRDTTTWNDVTNTNLIAGTFVVESGGIYNNNVNGKTIIKNGGNFNVNSGGIVNNAGKFQTFPTGTTTVSGEWNEQSGTSNDVFGTFDVASDGTYDNESGGVTKTRNGGSFNVQSGGIVNNAGTFHTFSAGTTTVSGEWNEQSGTTNHVYGIFNIASGGVYDNESGGVTKTRNAANFNVQSGGTVNNVGQFITQAGGTTTVNSGGTVNNSGEYTTLNTGTTTVSGEWNEQSDMTNNVFGTFNVASGGFYDNEAGATTKTRNGGSFNVQSNAILNNTGNFVTQATGTTTLSGKWNEKSGMTNEVFGIFNVASGGVYDNKAGATTKTRNGGNFNLQSGGKMDNDGVFVTFTTGTASLADEFDNNSGARTDNWGTMSLECGGSFNDLGNFRGNTIVNNCQQ